MSAARYWNRMAKRYAKSAISDPGVYEEKLRRTQAHLRPDMTVLEVGCGAGDTARRHAPLVSRYRGIDVSAEMIRIARERTGDGAPPGLTFEVGEAAGRRPDSGSEGERVDVVLMLNLLHLMPNWRETMVAARDALKPGGLFVTSTACLTDSHAWLRWVAPVARAAGLFPPLAFFGRGDFLETMERCGFEIVESWVPAPKAALFAIARAR